jgi:hypothetical protein
MSNTREKNISLKTWGEEDNSKVEVSMGIIFLLVKYLKQSSNWRTFSRNLKLSPRRRIPVQATTPPVSEHDTDGSYPSYHTWRWGSGNRLMHGESPPLGAKYARISPGVMRHWLSVWGLGTPGTHCATSSSRPADTSLYNNSLKHSGHYMYHLL